MLKAAALKFAVKLKARFAKENIMANKEDYLEGYGQGLQTGTKNPVSASITRTLDMALGNPHESAKRGYDQGMKEMKEAQKAEAEKQKEIEDKKNEQKRKDHYRAVMNAAFKKGGKVKAKCMSKGGSTASKRADGCATKGKTKGRII